MPRRTAATIMRDRHALALRGLGQTWAQIATDLGFTGESVARAAANRAARRAGQQRIVDPRRAAAGRTAARARFANPPQPTAVPQPVTTGPVGLGLRTWGLEIEYRRARKDQVAAAIAAALGVPHIHCFGYHGNNCETCGQRVPDTERYTQWKVERDGSVTIGNGGATEYGGEVVSPVLTLEGDGLGQVKKVLRALRAQGATVDRKCGLHLHIGVGDMTAFGRAAVVTRFAEQQEALFKFVARGRRTNFYCKPFQITEGDRVAQRIAADEHPHIDKMYALNVLPYFTQKRTFEVRMHQGTLAFGKVKAWVGLMLAFFHFTGVMNGVTPLRPAGPNWQTDMARGLTTTLVWANLLGQPDAAFLRRRLTALAAA